MDEAEAGEDKNKESDWGQERLKEGASEVDVILARVEQRERTLRVDAERQEAGMAEAHRTRVEASRGWSESVHLASIRGHA